MSNLDLYRNLISENWGATQDDVSCDAENAIRSALRFGEDVSPYFAAGYLGSDGRWYVRFS